MTSPLDVCQCGDFRRQHRYGVGHCLLGSMCGCSRFRLSHTEAQYAAENPKHHAKMTK
jgi:hypothetical protein